MRIEEAMKSTYPSFKGFYHQARYNKCLHNFDEIMSQVPVVIRDRAGPQSHQHNDVIEIEVGCDIKKKTFHGLKEERSRN